MHRRLPPMEVKKETISATKKGMSGETVIPETAKYIRLYL